MSQEDSAVKRLKAVFLRAITCCHDDEREDERPLQIGYPTVMRREEITIAGLTDEQHAFIREKAVADAARMFGGAAHQLPLRSHHVAPQQQQQQQQLLQSLHSDSSSQLSLSPTSSSRQSCDNPSPRSSPTLAPQLSSSSSSSPPPSAEGKHPRRVSQLVKRLSARICGAQQHPGDEASEEVKVVDDRVSGKHASGGASHGGLGLGITQAGAAFGMSGDSITLGGGRADTEGGDERVVDKNGSGRGA